MNYKFKAKFKDGTEKNIDISFDFLYSINNHQELSAKELKKIVNDLHLVADMVDKTIAGFIKGLK